MPDPTGRMSGKCLFAVKVRHSYVRMGQTHARPTSAGQVPPMHTAETQGNHDLWEWKKPPQDQLPQVDNANVEETPFLLPNDSCMMNTLSGKDQKRP